MFTVAYMTYRYTKTTKKINAFNEIKRSFNELNKIVLNNPDILEILEDATRPQYSDQTIEKKRKRYIAFTLMNTLEAIYVEKKVGGIDEEYATNSLNKLVPFLVKDDDLFRHYVETGYDPDFLRYCRQFR